MFPFRMQSFAAPVLCALTISLAGCGGSILAAGPSADVGVRPSLEVGAGPTVAWLAGPRQGGLTAHLVIGLQLASSR